MSAPTATAGGRTVVSIATASELVKDDLSKHWPHFRHTVSRRDDTVCVEWVRAPLTPKGIDVLARANDALRDVCRTGGRQHRVTVHHAPPLLAQAIATINSWRNGHIQVADDTAHVRFSGGRPADIDVEACSADEREFAHAVCALASITAEDYAADLSEQAQADCVSHLAHTLLDAGNAIDIAAHHQTPHT